MTTSLRFGDLVASVRAYKQARLTCFGIVLESSSDGVLVGWFDGGEDLYREMEARWCLRRLGEGAARALTRPVVSAGPGEEATC